MKKYLLLAVSAMVLLSTPSQAGFVMKKHASVAVPAITSSRSEAPVMTSAANDAEHVTVSANESSHKTKKRSFVSRIFNKIAHATAEIPKALYVVLTLVWFGWLAMGINDNFEGWEWVISLLLYCLFWLPGVIYSLVKMKKYY